uniref:DNA-directed RNA polymerase subunit n=1 Tax=Discoplastis spathirhyncha TaxID=215771 RepID=A0A3G3LL82_9EUGL|nr:RNA polymerase beta' subunit [Discoplastis spathirhyncha]AYQ93473.1 RNA polymerase beta' subunit [Discoplastis spathirhyncha]
MIKQYIKINIASPQTILKWTERILPNGEKIGKITKIESKNFFNPTINGLFCEKIFGPIKTGQCLCKRNRKKQKLIKTKYKTLICSNCSIEITKSKTRRYRMGYIELNSPIIHIWYLNSIAKLLGVKLQTIVGLTYLKINITCRENFIRNDFITGGNAVKFLLKNLNIKNTNEKIKKESKNIENIKELSNDKEKMIIQKLKERLHLLGYFMHTKSKPEWMAISILPVLPPGLRPILKMEDNTIVTSDLNFLYSEIVKYNNKIKFFKKMLAPQILIRREKKNLQESIDTLINNGKIKHKSYFKNTPLKSLSDIINGKHGRFRENLLGKTVDYSGRSVIIVEPKLKLNECSIPIEIVNELFQPFLIKKLAQLKIIKNIREGKKKIKKNEQIIIEILKILTEKMRILLNRAPTLHRLGIQSFLPKLTSDKTIRLHPLVCSAFNADFDGDQMGVHLPLSLKSQSEARVLMISSNNCISPATGQPNIVPSQDMILGCYFLTIENTNLFYLLKKIIRFQKIKKALEEYNKEKIMLHSYIWIHANTNNIGKNKFIKIKNKQKKINKKLNFKRTTIGRVIFNKTILELI